MGFITIFHHHLRNIFYFFPRMLKLHQRDQQDKDSLEKTRYTSPHAKNAPGKILLINNTHRHSKVVCCANGLW